METVYCFHGYRCKIPSVICLPAKRSRRSRKKKKKPNVCKAENELYRSCKAAQDTSLAPAATWTWHAAAALPRFTGVPGSFCSIPGCLVSRCTCGAWILFLAAGPLWMLMAERVSRLTLPWVPSRHCWWRLGRGEASCGFPLGQPVCFRKTFNSPRKGSFSDIPALTFP